MSTKTRFSSPLFPPFSAENVARRSLAACFVLFYSFALSGRGKSLFDVKSAVVLPEIHVE